MVNNNLQKTIIVQFNNARVVSQSIFHMNNNNDYNYYNYNYNLRKNKSNLNNLVL